VQQPEIQIGIMDGLSIGFEVGEGGRHGRLGMLKSTVERSLCNVPSMHSLPDFSAFANFT
jgi:hypothetical protein